MTEPARSLAFSPELDELVRTGMTRDADGVLAPAAGTSTVNNLIVLRNLHMELQAQATLEVGLAYGASALVFAQSHLDLGRAPTGQHVAIDPFQHEMGNSGLRLLEDAGLSGYLTHANNFSDRVLPGLLEAGRSFQLIYVDGSHLFEDVFVDALYSAQLLDIGGVVLFDDSSDPHVAKVLRFMRGNLRNLVEEIDLSPYRSEGGRSLRYRIGKRLGRVQMTGFRKVGAARRPWNSPLVGF